MTVRELIDLLEKVPENYAVISEGGGGFEVSEIGVRR